MAYKFNPFTGNLDEVGAGGSASAAGADTQVQFNSSGAFAGSTDLTWDDTAKELGVGGDINLDDGGTFATTLQLITPTANRTISFPDATGTVGLVGGSSGQLVYNNAGAYAGASNTSVGASGNITLSLAGAASTPPVSLTGTWFSGGTSTTTKPQLLIEPNGTTSTAWSTSGTGLGVNAASGFAGNLLDLQVDGTSRFSVSSALTGSIYLGSGYAGSLTVSHNNAETALTSPVALGFTTAGQKLKLYHSAPDLILESDRNIQALRLRTGSPSSDVAVRPTYLSGANAIGSAVNNLTGGNVEIEAGGGASGSAGNANGGDVKLDGGQGYGTGQDGSIVIGSVRGLAQIASNSTVGNLPSSPAIGMLTRVTDASAPAVGSNVVGGGAAAALVWYNGTNWTVIGV